MRVQVPPRPPDIITRVVSEDKMQNFQNDNTEEKTNLQRKEAYQPAKGSRKPIKALVIGVIIVLLVSPGIILFSIASIHFAKCEADTIQLENKTRSKVSTFKKISLLGDSPESTKVSVANGGCIDTVPSVSASKQLTVGDKGEELINAFKSSMARQGFRLKKESYKNSCGADSYSGVAEGSSISFHFELSKYLEGQECYASPTFYKNEEDFKNYDVHLNRVYADLTIYNS